MARLPAVQEILAARNFYRNDFGAACVVQTQPRGKLPPARVQMGQLGLLRQDCLCRDAGSPSNTDSRMELVPSAGPSILPGPCLLAQTRSISFVGTPAAIHRSGIFFPTFQRSLFPPPLLGDTRFGGDFFGHAYSQSATDNLDLPGRPVLVLGLPQAAESLHYRAISRHTGGDLRPYLAGLYCRRAVCRHPLEQGTPDRLCNLYGSWHSI